MTKFRSFYLFLFFIFITRFDTFKCQDNDESDDDDHAAAPPDVAHSGGEGGAVEGEIGAHDGKCECCDGEGIKCGVRLKWCGAKDCDPHNLYYCDKNNKKAYEFEICKHICIANHDKTSPDFCSIKIDNHFFYARKEKFDEIKKEINNKIDNWNKTARANYEKFQHSFDISPEEKAAIIKKQEEEEKIAKEKANQKAKPKTTTARSTTPEANEQE